MKKLILSTIVSCSLFAEQSYNLILDPYLSPYVGAEDLIIAHSMVEDAHLYDYLRKPLFSRTPILEGIGRFSEMFLFWNPINYTAMVTQHEVFGHGYRVRSIRDKGADVVRYKIGVPPPYGKGGGLTLYEYYPSKTSIFQRTVITSGGVESTAILANRLRLQWLKENKISPAQASLYSYSQQDITDYILTTQKFSGGDMHEYVQMIQRMYGENFSVRDLKKRAYLNFLDPFTYYSLYSIWGYISRGTEGSIPMIPLGSYRYLPSARMGLSPFGPEYYVENFLVKDDSPIYFYVRGGSFAKNRYTGLGIEYPYLWKFDTLSFGVRADVWLQPVVNFNHYSIEEFVKTSWTPLHLRNSRLGTSISLICQKKIWETGSFFLQAGGKSQGYLPGEELSAGLIFRIGLTLW